MKGTCSVGGCIRPLYNKTNKLCRAHYLLALRQRTAPAKTLKARHPHGHTIRFCGISLLDSTVATLVRTAEQHGISPHNLLVRIVDEWAKSA